MCGRCVDDPVRCVLVSAWVSGVQGRGRPSGQCAAGTRAEKKLTIEHPPYSTVVTPSDGLCRFWSGSVLSCLNISTHSCTCKTCTHDQSSHYHHLSWVSIHISTATKMISCTQLVRVLGWAAVFALSLSLSLLVPSVQVKRRACGASLASRASSAFSAGSRGARGHRPRECRECSAP